MQRISKGLAKNQHRQLPGLPGGAGQRPLGRGPAARRRAPAALRGALAADPGRRGDDRRGAAEGRGRRADISQGRPLDSVVNNSCDA